MRVIDLDVGGDGSSLNELSSLTVLRNKWCARSSPISDFLNYLVDYQGKAGNSRRAIKFLENFLKCTTKIKVQVWAFWILSKASLREWNR